MCLYKLLAMLLTNRLRRVVSKVIFDFQTTFVREYQILDGVLITNDLVDKSKYDNKEVLFFKVDFKRTYELVCWEFLDYMMMRIGFSLKCRSWIHECLSIVVVSILVNDNQTNEFNMHFPFLISNCC